MTPMTTDDVADLAEARRLAANGQGAAIRERVRVPQVAVASAIGVSPSVVNKWERGRRTPTGLAAVEWVRLLRRLAADDDR